MSEWKKVKLDDCLELITHGFTNPMPDTISGPWKVTAKDIVNGKINYSSARHTSKDAFDNELMIRHIDELLAGHEIEKPTYDFVNHTRSVITEVVKPCDVLLLEGLFVLENEDIRKRLDMKLYIDTDADIRFIRRLKRDVRDRGRTIESVCDQYMTTVRVMQEAFVEPSKRKADIIIPEGSHNEVAMDLLLTKINSIIADHKNGN